MIILRTGLPGASKTLTTVKEVCSLDDLGECPIYYNNIKYLLLDIEVCKSFAGFYFGFHAVKAIPKADAKIIDRVHKSGRLITQDDFTTLIPAFEDWFSSGGPVKLFISILKRCYSSKLLADLLTHYNSYPDTPIEYYQIFNLDWRYFSDPHSWPSLPSPSKIIIDECQQFFPPRPAGSKVPPAVSAFETHRHTGSDIYLITQDAKLIDVNVRRLVNMHVHLFNVFGSKRVRRVQKMESFDPNDFFSVKSADTTIIKHPTNFYGVYLSSLNHTHKLKLPKTFFLILFLFVFAIFFAIYMISHFSSYTDLVSSTDTASQPSLHVSTSIQPNKQNPSFSFDLSNISKLLGCSAVSYTGHDYSNNQLDIFINCHLSEVETYTIQTGEDSEPFTYSHPKTVLYDSFMLSALGISFNFQSDRLFLVHNGTNYFLTRIF